MNATIRRDSPRYATWMEIFGRETIAILEPPKVGLNGGLRMLVDVGSLTDAQRQRVAVKMAERSKIPSGEALAMILRTGSAPISAEDVDVSEESARLF